MIDKSKQLVEGRIVVQKSVEECNSIPWFYICITASTSWEVGNNELKREKNNQSLSIFLEELELDSNCFFL
jgi:hypothetical protein